MFESSVDGDVLVQQLNGGGGGGGGGAERDSSYRHGSDVDGELFEKSRHDSAPHSGPERHGSAVDDDGSQKHSPSAADGTKRHGSEVDGDGSQKRSHAAADGTKRHGSDVDGDGSQKHSPAAADGTKRHGSDVDGDRSQKHSPAAADGTKRHGSDVDGDGSQKHSHPAADGTKRHGSDVDGEGSQKHPPAAADGTKRHGSDVDGDGSQKHSHPAADGTKRHGSDVDGEGSQKYSPAAADETKRHGSEVDGEALAERKDYAAGADEVFGPAGPDEGRRRAVGVDPNPSNRPQEPATGSRNAQLSDDYDEDYVKLLKRSMSEKEGYELHQARQLLRWHYRHLPDAERDDTVFRLMLFAPGLPNVRPSTLQRLLHTASGPLSPALSPGPAGQGPDPSAAGSQHESGVSSLDSGDEEAMEAWVQAAVTRSVEFRTEFKARRQGQEAEARSLSQRVLQLAMRDGKETRGAGEKKAAEHDEIVPTSGAAAAGNQPAAVGVSC